jgi:hypothetical protein
MILDQIRPQGVGDVGRYHHGGDGRD